MLDKCGVSYNCRNVDDLFFSNRVVVDILNIIRFAYDPQNGEIFLRLYYKFGSAISKRSAQYAIEKSRTSKKPLFEELMHAPDIRGPVQDAVIDLMQNLPRIQTDHAETAIHRIWEAMHYGRYVDQRKLDRGKYFILCMLAKGIDNPQLFLEKLDRLRITIGKHCNSDQNKVILSTIHSSKGLEYDTVYLADIMDGVLPSKTKNEAEDIDEIKQYEEDRRLYYVGMTRAKNRLYLFSCGEPSSFTAEIVRALPTPVVNPDDIFAPLLLPQVGKQFSDITQGVGEIVAECAGQNLIAFADGHCELLSINEMLLRRNTAVEYAVQEKRPAAPPVNNPALKKIMDDHLLSQLHVGGFVQHRSFGTGKILSIKDDILTADFGEKGVRKLALSMSLQNNLLRMR
jgi:DNA helicase-2/ATP-dependent DNA helicase PcrA